jgi:hypothetical protein
MQGVRRLVGSLRTYQLREDLKDCCCRECTESRRSNTQEYLIDFRKECVQEFFRGLKLPERKLRRVNTFESTSKGDEGEVISRSKVQWKNFVHFTEVVQEQRAVEILRGEFTK